MDKAFYLNVFYPFQDEVLRILNEEIETGFYLTGGTAASRGYLNHRFSDDLDFFINDDNRFGLWSERVIQKLSQQRNWRCDVLQKEERFVRLNLAQGDIFLKIEFINDVPARVGDPWSHPILGRLDSAENILANKLTALLGREEPKDLADVWGFCSQMNLSLTAAIEDAQSKAAGIFPVDLARVLCSVNRSDWELVRWIDAPTPEQFIGDLQALGEKLILIP
ncbi:MAG: hypothetical protein DPW09_23065 [Anaerolineae bacterium]|nr:nucleotidyl transferase AbiEii/AbiGii toxin family protein [Anaerolineales bacterium]MCQ3976320.1 hypothetical protein [Anaerolineae bacterium]